MSDAGRERALVLPLVAGAQRARAAARGAESALLAVAGLCVTLGAACASGATLAAPDAWVAAALGALASGGAWWCAHRRAEGDAARELDRALHCDGALFTAWEAEARGRGSRLARELARRVAARTRLADCVRALVPSPALPIAAPFAALAALALALDARRADPPPETVAPALAGLSASVSEARAAAQAAVGEGQLDVASARRLASLERAAAELATALARGDDARAGAAELARLELELGELARALGRRGELAQRVEEARLWADAARMGLARARPDASAPRAAEPAPSAGGATGTGAAELTVPGADGTMTASSEADPVASSGASAGGAPPVEERAGAPGRWWPARYDGVVERWVESRRGAGDEPR